MKTKKLLMSFIIVFGVLISSCKKPEKGDTGAAGKNGNANVSSTILTVYSWTWDATNYWRYANFSSVPLITYDIANSGMVMLYQKTSSGSYIAVPVTQTTATGSTVEHDWFVYGTGQLSVYIENADLTDPISQIPQPTNYKLVCIPAQSLIVHPNINFQNYNQVKSAFNLKD